MADTLSVMFAALADPTRRAVLEQLAGGDATVGELAAPHRMTLPSFSRHLKVLESAGLVTKRVDGQRRRCHLEAGRLRAAEDWLAEYRQFFATRFDRLEQQLLTKQQTHTGRNQRSEA